MKKLIVIVSLVILTGIVLYGVYSLFLKRTPEKILKTVFNISLKDFDYSIDVFEEEWCPNGDGHTLVAYKFNKLTQENIDYLKKVALKPLPISKIDIQKIDYNRIPEKYFRSDAGYYIYELLSTHDPRDYQVLIIDTVKKMLVLYYQYM